MSELIMTAGEANQLYEEKIQRLRSDAGHAERASRDASLQRDKAMHEVTLLQKERSKLTDELEQVKVDRQRIMDSLAEHRRNVEASLARQEEAARVTIDKADALQAQLAAQQQQLHQLRSQLEGIRKSMESELDRTLSTFTTVIRNAQGAIHALPNGRA
jgi:chromosome segregation ATPase